jgi:tetratricopeptide (TPR) repeat protein
MQARAALIAAIIWAGTTSAAEEHSHAAPERLGHVKFETSCAANVEERFDRAVALLHSFAYAPAEHAFLEVAQADPQCAMAYWGVAMSRYHPLWSAPNDEDLREGLRAVEAARELTTTPREQMFIDAAAAFYQDAERRPHIERARAYEQAMTAVAAQYPEDTEAQIFHALALLSIAQPTDRTHAQQRRAAQILEPLYRKLPDHPGLAHYLIHAYDSVELASQGVEAARAYSQIAASAPHALHMPSHIFTRLGLWEDSIASNLAARRAAQEEGDIGEALHAMDYLTYAYLQLGRFAEAEAIANDAARATSESASEFKFGYALNAMPVRLAMERADWTAASTLQPRAGSIPQVAAIVHWARSVGNARAGNPEKAAHDIQQLEQCREKLLSSADEYWATQTSILEQEARAWLRFAERETGEAIALMRAAADTEDAVEKLPVTPGPIVPAREQLGEMLLASGNGADALTEFQAALKTAPGRRGAMLGAQRAKELIARR